MNSHTKYQMHFAIIQMINVSFFYMFEINLMFIFVIH